MLNIPELDQKIFLYADLGSLSQISQVNKQCHQVIQDDYFWKSKLIKDYGKEVLNEKPSELSFAEEYLDIVKISSEQAAILNRIDILTAHDHIGLLDIQQIYCSAYKTGNVTVLNWLKKNNLITDKVLKVTTTDGIKLSTLNWLSDNNYLRGDGW